MLLARNEKEIKAMIAQVVAKAMQTTVAKGVKELESQNAVTYVYDEYTSTSTNPDKYIRRGIDGGGIGDVDNMSHSVNITGNSIDLSVENNTMSNPDFMPRYGTPHLIVGEIEGGFGYDYGGYGAEFEEERPFIRETRNELASGKAKKLLQEGLKLQGIKSI